MTEHDDTLDFQRDRARDDKRIHERQREDALASTDAEWTTHQIHAAARYTNLDVACAIVQRSFGQTDGGLAGIMFSDLEDGEWAKLPYHERVGRMVEYWNAEKRDKAEREKPDTASFPSIDRIKWREAGPAENPRTRLTATIAIIGQHMHLEAVETETDNNEGRMTEMPVDPAFRDEFAMLQEAQGETFQTTRIEGRFYVLHAVPFGSAR